MPRLRDALSTYGAYAFIVVGLIWLVIAFADSSTLTAWPVVACLVSGFLLRVQPGGRLTWAWANSSAVLGFLLSAYQVAVAVPLVGGSLTIVASLSAGAFAGFALAHVFLIFAGNPVASETV